LLTQRVVMMFFIAFVGVVIVAVSRMDGLPYGAFLLYKKSAGGTVIQFKENNMNNILTYEFIDSSGDRYENTEYVDASTYFSVKPGDNLKITYFPFYPKISSPTPLVRFRKTGFQIMSLGLLIILVAGIIAVATFKRLYSHGKEDRKY